VQKVSGDKLGALTQAIGITPDSILDATAVFTGIPKGPDAENLFTIIRTTKPVDTSKLESGEALGQKFEKKEVDGKVLLASPSPMMPSVCVVAPQTIWIATEKMLTERLAMPTAREGPLADAIKEASTSKALIFAAGHVTPEASEKLAQGAEFVKAIAPGAENLADLVAASFSLSEGKNVQIALKLTFSDPDKANKAKEGVESLVKLGVVQFEDLKKGFGADPKLQKPLQLAEGALASVKPSVEGQTLVIPLQVEATLAELAELGMKAFTIEKQSTSAVPSLDKKEVPTETKKEAPKQKAQPKGVDDPFKLAPPDPFKLNLPDPKDLKKKDDDKKGEPGADKKEPTSDKKEPEEKKDTNTVRLPFIDSQVIKARDSYAGAMPTALRGHESDTSSARIGASRVGLSHSMPTQSRGHGTLATF
jgi:hypothetical protein